MQGEQARGFGEVCNKARCGELNMDKFSLGLILALCAAFAAVVILATATTLTVRYRCCGKSGVRLVGRSLNARE